MKNFQLIMFSILSLMVVVLMFGFIKKSNDEKELRECVLTAPTSWEVLKCGNE